MLTTGTLLLMWLGEQITERGIGNGVSLVITIGILARLPQAGQGITDMFFPGGGVEPGSIFSTWRCHDSAAGRVVAGVIAVTQAQRKIPVQYAQRAVGRKVYAGRHFLHAVARQLRGRHADHLCAGDPDVSRRRSFRYLGQSLGTSSSSRNIAGHVAARGAWLYLTLVRR